MQYFIVIKYFVNAKLLTGDLALAFLCSASGADRSMNAATTRDEGEDSTRGCSRPAAPGGAVAEAK